MEELPSWWRLLYFAFYYLFIFTETPSISKYLQNSPTNFLFTNKPYVSFHFVPFYMNLKWAHSFSKIQILSASHFLWPFRRVNEKASTQLGIQCGLKTNGENGS